MHFTILDQLSLIFVELARQVHVRWKLSGQITRTPQTPHPRPFRRRCSAARQRRATRTAPRSASTTIRPSPVRHAAAARREGRGQSEGTQGEGSPKVKEEVKPGDLEEDLGEWLVYNSIHSSISLWVFTSWSQNGQDIVLGNFYVFHVLKS